LTGENTECLAINTVNFFQITTTESETTAWTTMSYEVTTNDIPKAEKDIQAEKHFN
jgi:hypothetical protein